MGLIFNPSASSFEVQRHNLSVWQVKNVNQHLRDITNIYHVPISSSHTAPCLRRLKGAQRVCWVSESNCSAPRPPPVNRPTRAPGPGVGLGHPLAGSSLILHHRVRVLYSRHFLTGYNICPTSTSSCFQVTLTMKYSALSDDADLNTHITTTSAQRASIHGRELDTEQLGLRPPAKRGSTILTFSVVERLYLSESCFLRYKT